MYRLDVVLPSNIDNERRAAQNIQLIISSAELQCVLLLLKTPRHGS